MSCRGLVTIPTLAQITLDLFDLYSSQAAHYRTEGFNVFFLNFKFCPRLSYHVYEAVLIQVNFSVSVIETRSKFVISLSTQTKNVYA